MSKYVTELKNRVILIISAWILVALISYVYKEILIYILIKPCLQSHASDIKFYFITTNFTEIVEVYFKTIFFTGNNLIVPYLSYHVLKFFSPGLYQYENSILKRILTCFITLYCCFGIVMYTTLLPYSWEFFYKLTPRNLNVFLEPKLTEYFNFFVITFTIIIFYSQFLTLFLETLLSYPRYIIKIKNTKKSTYFGMIVISTLITPPDIFSLILTSCFLIGIYELFIILFLTFKKI